MNLKAFHIVFIAAASVLALGLTLWSWHAGSLIMAIISALSLLALMGYGPWFWRKMKRLQVLIAVLLVGTSAILPEPLWACAVCFGDPNSLMAEGARYGVFVLVAVVGLLLSGIVAIAWRWQQRP